MYLKENILLALSGLRANKMRALLTMLGIIIGISSVITITTIGNAVSRSVSDLFADLGANSIQIYVQSKPDEYGNINWGRGFEEEDLIQDEMIDQYLEMFGSQVDCWAVSQSVGSADALNGNNSAKGNVTGVNANALGIQNINIIAGRDLNEQEVDGDKWVIVLSDRFVRDLFPRLTPQQAIGREVKLRLAQGTYTFMVVGVYKYEVSGFAATMTGDTSTTIFIPLGVSDTILQDGSTDTSEWMKGYYQVQIRANSTVTDSQLFAQQTEDFFNKRFYRSNPYYQISAQSMDSMIGSMTSMMSTIQTAISVIAAISLLVGGIGVMNIMLVSVTERTREIGTRKALGAKNSAIRIQFIVESMIICMIGGIIGVLLGTTVGLLGSALLKVPGTPSVPAILIAVGFSMAIGIFFGYYPANKAAKLDPIEALRYE